MKKAAIIYQFCILAAIIGLTIYFAVTTQELNDTLIGALIGVMAGLALRADGEVEVRTKEIEVNQDESIH